MEFIEFTAQTKMSGVNLENGLMLRKGAGEAIREFVVSKTVRFRPIWMGLWKIYQSWAEHRLPSAQITGSTA